MYAIPKLQTKLNQKLLIREIGKDDISHSYTQIVFILSYVYTCLMNLLLKDVVCATCVNMRFHKKMYKRKHCSAFMLLHLLRCL